MITRSKRKIHNFNVKSICGKKFFNGKEFYLVSWEEEDTIEEYVSKELLRFNPLREMVENYEKKLIESKGKEQIVISMPTLNLEDDDDIIVIPIEEKKQKCTNICQNKKLKTNKEESQIYCIPKKLNSFNNNKPVMSGKIVYDPITIDGKCITIADILKWSKRYNKFNDYKSQDLLQIFARSYEVCYDDIVDYKFFGLTNTKKIIVFTKSQITFQQFYLPAYKFFTKYPFNSSDPPF